MESDRGYARMEKHLIAIEMIGSLGSVRYKASRKVVSLNRGRIEKGNLEQLFGGREN